MCLLEKCAKKYLIIDFLFESVMRFDNRGPFRVARLWMANKPSSAILYKVTTFWYAWSVVIFCNSLVVSVLCTQ